MYTSFTIHKAAGTSTCFTKEETMSIEVKKHVQHPPLEMAESNEEPRQTGFQSVLLITSLFFIL